MNLRLSGKSMSSTCPKPRDSLPQPIPQVLRHKCPNGVSPGGLYPNNTLNDNAKVLSRRPCKWGETEEKQKIQNDAVKPDEYVHNLQQQIYFLELEVEHLKTKGGTTTTNVVQGKQALDVKLIEFQSIFDELKNKSNKKLLEMKKENENIQKQLNEKVAKLVTLKNEIDSIQRDKDNIIDQYDKLKLDIDKMKYSFQFQLQGKDKEYQELRNRYNDLSLNFTRISTEYDILQKHTKGDKENDDKDIENYKKLIDKYNKERTDLLQQKTKLEIENGDYKSQIEIVTGNMDKLTIEMSHKDELCMKCENSLSEIDEQNKILKEQNNQKISELAKQKAENETNRKTIDHLHSQHEDLIHQHSLLVSEKDKTDRLFDGEKVTSNHLQQQLDDLVQKYRSIQDELSGTQVLIAKYETDDKILEEINKQRNIEDDEIKVKNIELLSTIQVLNNRHDELTDEIRKLKHDLTSQQELCVQLHIENEQLKKEKSMYDKIKDLKIESLNHLMKSNIEAAATIDGFMRSVRKEESEDEMEYKNYNQ